MQAQVKDQIVISVLDTIAKKGCYGNLLEEASTSAGLDPFMAEALFPEKLPQILRYYFQQVNQEMLREFQAKGQELNTQERILSGISMQLDIMGDRREAIKKILAYCSSPWNYKSAIELLWENLDFIWYNLGGDKATDFNYYTKRALLAKVYIQTLFYWAKDDSEGFQSTKEFLKQTLSSTAKLGKTLGEVVKKCAS